MSTNIEAMNQNDFKSICRTCMSSCEYKFIQDCVITEVYHKLTDIHFGANDELPQHICRSCFEKINEIHNFALQCKRTNSTLTKRINSNKNVGSKPDMTEEIKEEITIDENEIEFIPDDENNSIHEYFIDEFKMEQDVKEEPNEYILPDMTKLTSEQIFIIDRDINSHSESDYDSDSDSDSDSDDLREEEVMLNILLYRRREARHSIEHFVKNVQNYSENEFITQFRVGRNVSHQLINQFRESAIFRNLFSTSGGRQPISAEKHILSFLYFVGHEAAGYRAVNNIFNMSISTLYCVISRVAEFICGLSSQFIKWPHTAALNDAKAYFQYYKSIPNVIGAIDSSRIIIDKPTNDPESYVNKNGNYSIQLQGIVNHENKFLDVYIGYPGSVHDAAVFKNSTICNNLPLLCEGGYILGDSAYPLTVCLLTPFKDNGELNGEQKYFNQLHASARVYVDDCFKFLKQRFRQLHHLKLRKPSLIVQIIKSCCILHNIADIRDISVFEEAAENDIQISGNDDEDDDDNDEIEDTNDGKIIRNKIAHQLWQIHNQ